MRFYPDEFPEFWNEPTRDRFEIKDYGDQGVGVRALVDFAKGEELFRFTGAAVTKVTQYSLQVTDKLHIHDPWFMGRVLHSCNPNSIVDMSERSFTATRNITAGEPITMDYNSTEEILYKPFICQCSPECKTGEVGGSLWKSGSDEAKISRLLHQNNWRFAKTLQHIPHFYSRGREWSSWDDFVWACDYIQKNSTKGTFSPTGKYQYNYFHLGKWKYWVMERDKPADQQILINRAVDGYSYDKSVRL